MSDFVPDHIVGRAEQDFYDITNFTGKSELGKEDFLTLLVTQLEYQDPLNPMDDTAFVAQLAEFSSLEQLTAINDGISGMSEDDTLDYMIGASNFIGRDVIAAGNGLSIKEGQTSALYYSLRETAADVKLNIYDQNNNLLRTVDQGARQVGSHIFDWDGKDWGGRDLPDGVYKVGISAHNGDGRSVLVDTEVSGRVVGVSNVGGEYQLRLSDGRVVKFSEVYEVVDINANDSGGATDSGDGQNDSNDDGSNNDDSAGDGSGGA